MTPIEEDEEETLNKRRELRFLSCWFNAWMLAFPLLGYILGGGGVAAIFALLGFFVFFGMLKLFD